MSTSHRKNMMFCSAALVLALLSTAQAEAADPLDQYDVVWTSASKDATGSMPVGNGDIGLNVWVEEGGNLVFYIGKTDSWSENGRLLKMGRVRVKLSPNPFVEGAPFQQALRLLEGKIEITAGPKGSEVAIVVWVDAGHPVVRVEAVGEKDFDMQVAFETWREVGYKLQSTTVSDMFNFDNHTTSTPMDQNPYPTVVHPDVILPGQSDRIVWYHHNVKSPCALIMKHQGLESFLDKMTDPLLHRTFGGTIRGEGFVSSIDTAQASDTYVTKKRVKNDRTLKTSQPGRKHRFNVYLLTKHPATQPEWLGAMEELIARVESVDIERARAAHRAWWDEFWNRSWIRATGNEDAEVVSAGYALQRYLFACSGRGAYPIKFNGSLFTVEDPNEGHSDPDYRRWGPAFWFMNTRALYWPMMTSGDFDLMQPYFGLYLNALPMAKERNRIYFGHAGAHFPEQLYFWGGYPTDHYGWDRTGKHVSDVECRWTARLWQGGLELVAIMLDYYAHTQDEQFLQEKLLPVADEIITFYDLHYQRDENGKLRIWPAQSLEAWWDCTNPMPEVAGLTFVLSGLLDLPEDATQSKRRELWKRLQSEVPPIPTRQVNGETILAPAEKFAEKANRENCELYAIFPYRIYGIGKPNLEIVQRTLANPFDDHFRNGVYMAYMGLVDESRDYIAKLARPTSRMRFKHFNLEQFPLSFMMMLQAMLLQYDDEKILLAPTWPKKWDVDFKLHAPQNTTVEGTYRNGKIELLKVTPKSRAKDVVIELQPG